MGQGLAAQGQAWGQGMSQAQLAQAMNMYGLNRDQFDVNRLATLTGLDQTAMEYFNPSNAFDAEGLTRLTEEIELRKKLPAPGATDMVLRVTGASGGGIGVEPGRRSGRPICRHAGGEQPGDGCQRPERERRVTVDEPRRDGAREKRVGDVVKIGRAHV